MGIAIQGTIGFLAITSNLISSFGHHQNVVGVPFIMNTLQ
jgi:hypothetical protein